ncbi:hypothetical protein C8J56DRAFT_1063953 [Mycena floridula]|nr:hypothetical protein C8J56DRAFT_1063953 [Mycena floridula]
MPRPSTGHPDIKRKPVEKEKGKEKEKDKRKEKEIEKEKSRPGVKTKRLADLVDEYDNEFDSNELINVDEDARPLNASTPAPGSINPRPPPGPLPLVDPAPVKSVNPVQRGGHNLRNKVTISSADGGALDFLKDRATLPVSQSPLMPPLTEHRHPRSPTKPKPPPNPDTTTVSWSGDDLAQIMKLPRHLRVQFTGLPKSPECSPAPKVPPLSLGPSISTSTFFQANRDSLARLDASSSPFPSTSSFSLEKSNPVPSRYAYLANRRQASKPGDQSIQGASIEPTNVLVPLSQMRPPSGMESMILGALSKSRSKDSVSTARPARPSALAHISRSISPTGSVSSTTSRPNSPKSILAQAPGALRMQPMPLDLSAKKQHTLSLDKEKDRQVSSPLNSSRECLSPSNAPLISASRERLTPSNLSPLRSRELESGRQAQGIQPPLSYEEEVGIVPPAESTPAESTPPSLSPRGISCSSYEEPRRINLAAESAHRSVSPHQKPSPSDEEQRRIDPLAKSARRLLSPRRTSLPSCQEPAGLDPPESPPPLALSQPCVPPENETGQIKPVVASPHLSASSHRSLSPSYEKPGGFDPPAASLRDSLSPAQRSPSPFAGELSHAGSPSGVPPSQAPEDDDEDDDDDDDDDDDEAVKEHDTPAGKLSAKALSNLIHASFTAIDNIIHQLANDTGRTAASLVKRWGNTALNHAKHGNLWNTYEKMLKDPAEFPHQAKRVKGTPFEVVGTSVHDTSHKQRAAMWKRYKKKCPKTYEDYVLSWELQQDMTTVHKKQERQREFDSYFRDMSERAERASTLTNFETILISAGSSVNSDANCAGLFVSSGVQGFVEANARVSQDKFIGNFKTWAYEYVRVETVDKAFGTVKEAVVQPVAVPMSNEPVESRRLTGYVRDGIISRAAAVKFDIPSNPFPWKTLLALMQLNGVGIENYHPYAKLPCDGIGKGFRRTTMLSRQLLLESLNSKTDPLVFVRHTPEALKNDQKPIIRCTRLTESSLPKVVYFSKGVRNAPPALSDEAAKRLLRDTKIGKTNSKSVRFASPESDVASEVSRPKTRSRSVLPEPEPPKAVAKRRDESPEESDSEIPPKRKRTVTQRREQKDQSPEDSDSESDPPPKRKRVGTGATGSKHIQSNLVPSKARPMKRSTAPRKAKNSEGNPVKTAAQGQPRQSKRKRTDDDVIPTVTPGPSLLEAPRSKRPRQQSIAAEPYGAPSSAERPAPAVTSWLFDKNATPAASGSYWDVPRAQQQEDWEPGEEGEGFNFAPAGYQQLEHEEDSSWAKTTIPQPTLSHEEQMELLQHYYPQD